MTTNTITHACLPPSLPSLRLLSKTKTHSDFASYYMIALSLARLARCLLFNLVIRNSDNCHTRPPRIPATHIAVCNRCASLFCILILRHTNKQRKNINWCEKICVRFIGGASRASATRHYVTIKTRKKKNNISATGWNELYMGTMQQHNVRQTMIFIACAFVNRNQRRRSTLCVCVTAARMHTQTEKNKINWTPNRNDDNDDVIKFVAYLNLSFRCISSFSFIIIIIFLVLFSFSLLFCSCRWSAQTKGCDRWMFFKTQRFFFVERMRWRIAICCDGSEVCLCQLYSVLDAQCAITPMQYVLRMLKMRIHTIIPIEWISLRVPFAVLPYLIVSHFDVLPFFSKSLTQIIVRFFVAKIDL